MRILNLEKTKSGYKAVDTDGEVVWETKTKRTYVAALGLRDVCNYRFGREDLIGKGASRFAVSAMRDEHWIAFGGDKIIDTHFGSGSIALAVDRVNKLDKMDLHLTGIELDEYYYEKSTNRITTKLCQGTMSF